MVLVDREEGGTQNMEDAGMKVFSVFKAAEVAAEYDRINQPR
jgi:orotate phosphoribosyltransferase